MRRGEQSVRDRTGVPAGPYVLSGLVAGAYTLAVRACGLRPAALPVSVRVSRKTRQDIELADGAVLRGVVRVPGGKLPAPGSYAVMAFGCTPVAPVLQGAGSVRTEHDVQLSHED